MNKKEAIEALNKWGVLFPSEAIEAIDIAMEALRNEKEGRWIVKRIGELGSRYVECDQCGMIDAWDEEDDAQSSALCGNKYARYCSNCGAHMVNQEEIEDEQDSM